LLSLHITSSRLLEAAMKTFLVTFIHDHLGRRTTVLRHAETEKAVKRWVRMTKTFYVEYKIEEVK
jgi:hypothetical protein